MYWDIQRSLTYNCLWNWIIGARGCGKTYGCKKYAIQRWLKYGEQFVYIRRYKEEISKIKNFFKDIAEEFPEWNFKVHAGEFLIQAVTDDPEDQEDEPWITIGYYLVLSNAITQKSVPYPRVNFIIFDEFILDKGYYRYLPDEVTAFLELYSTISRLRDVRLYFISNALTVTNPYFMYFKVQLPYKSNFWRDGEKLVEIVEDQEFTEAASNTRFASLIQGTDYAQYNIYNEFLRDTNTFIGKKTAQSKYCYTISWRGVDYGIWTDYQNGLVYVSMDVDPSALLHFSLSTDDHNPNRMLIKNKPPHHIQLLVKNYQIGCVRFETMNIKNAFTELLSHLVR